MKASRPGELAGSHGAGNFEALGSGFTSRNTDAPGHGQVSAALCAAGRCVAAAEHGLCPTEIRLSPGVGGHWQIQIDGLGSRTGDPLLLLAGAAARGLRDDEDFDLEALTETGLAIIALRGEFGPPLVAALRLIEKHKRLLLTLSDELMRHHRVRARRLRAHFRPVIEAFTAGERYV